MPITIFDCKGVPALRRERIEAAVVAGGRYRTRIFTTAPTLPEVVTGVSDRSANGDGAFPAGPLTTAGGLVPKRKKTV